MIKNIVFDMGQVMMKFDEDYFIDRLGIDDPEDRRMLKTEVFDSVEWVRMDRGSLKDWEAFDIIKERLPERLLGYAEKLILHWFEPVVPVDGMAGLAAELKSRGYKIYLLSNASHRQKEYWKNVPGSELFDGSVVSADYLIMKPQPEIYRLLLDKYGLIADECVFIDDFKVNCEGAYHCGMHPVIFRQDVKRLRKELKELGVDVNL